MKALLTPDSRRQFHAIFAAWMQYAPQEETDQLDQLLDEHPTTEVRSMVTFVRDCFADPIRQEQLPKNLRQRLEAVNWPLGVHALQVV